MPRDDIKLYCDACGRLAGFVGADGSGPTHTKCLAADKRDRLYGKHIDTGEPVCTRECPIVDVCDQFIEPKQKGGKP